MYQQQIIDHYKHPRNFGELKTKHHARVVNPLCGDEIDFYLEVGEDGKITTAQFSGRGCTISIAAGSMLTEKLIGRQLADITKMKPEDMISLLGVPVNPARLKCATLALEAAQQAAK